jgi:hypothetical protein
VSDRNSQPELIVREVGAAFDGMKEPMTNTRAHANIDILDDFGKSGIGRSCSVQGRARGYNKPGCNHEQ